MSDDDAFQMSLPRSDDMEGGGLMIMAVNRDGTVMITDGDRAAAYVAYGDEALSGTDLKIMPSYVEAGAYLEANCVVLTDGSRNVVYVPRERFRHRQSQSN